MNVSCCAMNNNDNKTAVVYSKIRWIQLKLMIIHCETIEDWDLLFSPWFFFYSQQGYGIFWMPSLSSVCSQTLGRSIFLIPPKAARRNRRKVENPLTLSWYNCISRAVLFHQNGGFLFYFFILIRQVFNNTGWCTHSSFPSQL